MPLSEKEEFELLQLERERAMHGMAPVEPSGNYLEEAQRIAEDSEPWARGAIQDMTLGMRDEMAGAIKNPKGALKKAASYTPFYKPSPQDSDVKDYEEERNLSRLIDDIVKKRDPVQYKLGELTGAIATGMVPGLGPLKTAEKASKLAKAARYAHMAGMGGLLALGNSRAENAGDLAKDTATGAALAPAIGAGMENVVYPAVGAVGGKIVPAFERVGNRFKDKAERLAENATGATFGEAENFKPGTGRYLLDNKLLGWLTSPKRLGKNVAKARAQAGQEIGDILESADKSGVMVNGDHVLDEALQEELALKNNDANKGAARSLRKMMSDIFSGERFPTEVERMKRTWQNKSNYLDPDANLANKAMARSYEKPVEDAVKRADADLYPKFMKASEDYGFLDPVFKATQNASKKMDLKPVADTADTIAAAAGGMAGGVPGATTALLAKKTLYPRLSSFGARWANATGDAINSIPRASGPIGSGIENTLMKEGVRNLTPEDIEDAKAYLKNEWDRLMRAREND